MNMKYLWLLFVWGWMPSIVMAEDSAYFNYSTTVHERFDLNTPPQIVIWDHTYISGVTTPNGFGVGTEVVLYCMSDTNTTVGKCPVTSRWTSLGKAVLLQFTEQRSHLTRDLWVTGEQRTSCGTNSPFAAVWGACDGGDIGYHVYLQPNELKKLPIGGIWKAHLKMHVNEWHGGAGAHGPYDYLDAYWESDITLNVTDAHNIRIWLP
ncbi:hypothetical protein PZ84_004955, partial [Salmonella enterica subsp. enterica]|nr:hypothetical protein [Salmonella enterica subsp. enterica]